MQRSGSPSSKQHFEQIFLLMRLLTAVFGASTVMMAIVAFLVPRNIFSSSDANLESVPVLLVILSLGLILTARPLLIRWHGSIASRFRSGKSQAELVKQLMVSQIVAVAIIEAGATIAFIISVITGQPLWSLGMAALALWNISRIWPNYNECAKLIGAAPAQALRSTAQQ